MSPSKTAKDEPSPNASAQDDIEARLEARAERKAKIEADRERARRREMLILDDLELEHGDDEVRPVWTRGGLVVIKRPSPAAYKQFTENQFRDKAKVSDKASNHRRLARKCVIHPNLGTYDEMCDKFPGIPDAVGMAAIKFSGETEEEIAGK